jgi:glycosyltransferase 2 family protein
MKLEHGLILVFITTVGIYATFLFISDMDIILEKISEFKLDFLPIILLLSSASWIPIFIKWHILLKNSKIDIPLRKSIAVFLSGPMFEITPGHIGILMKSQILKTGSNISRTKTIPIILSEKLYDLIGAIIASMIGIIVLELNPFLIIIAISVLTMIFFFIYYNPASEMFFKRITKTKFFSKYVDNISEFYETIKKSTNVKIAGICILLSLTYWVIISAAAYYTLIAFNINVLDYLEIFAIYTTSILLGAVTFIPGGIGITEGSIAGLFALNGINVSTALIVSIMIRILTLWYSVGIGFIALKFTGVFSFKNN